MPFKKLTHNFLLPELKVLTEQDQGIKKAWKNTSKMV